MASDIDWNVQSVMSSLIGVVVFLRQSVTCNIGATKYEKYVSVITSEHVCCVAFVGARWLTPGLYPQV